MIENWKRQRDRMDELINSYQNMPTNPVNNFINTTPAINKDLIEWRILNENEEVDNLFVNNKTLFINDELMVLKGVDGKTEKWKITKIYPIDKKDEKINELTLKIEELERRLNDEHTESNESTRKCDKSDGINDVNVESKPKANGKYVSK